MKQQRILQLMSRLRLADALDYTRKTDELLDNVTLQRGKLLLSLRPGSARSTGRGSLRGRASSGRPSA